MSTCTYAFRTGKKKDQLCGKRSDGLYCEGHKKKVIHGLVSAYNNSTLSASSPLDELYTQYMSIYNSLSNENKSVIEKKLGHLRSLKPPSNEYVKNVNWLRHALAFPYDNVIPVPVTCESSLVNVNKSSPIALPMTSSQDTNDYVSHVYKCLDDYVYGLEHVKEEIMTFVCKRIANPSASDHVLALQGGYGVGKCFAENTPILMFNGSTKMVQDVRVDDILMGDDNLPRVVHTLGQGEDELYKVKHLSTQDIEYTVNREHVLVLWDTLAHDVIEITVECYLQLPEYQRKTLLGYTQSVHLPFKSTIYCPYHIGNSLLKHNLNDEYLKYKCTCLKQDKKKCIRESSINIKNLDIKDYTINSLEVRTQVLCGILDNTNSTQVNEKNKVITSTLPHHIVPLCIQLCTSLGIGVHTINKSSTLTSIELVISPSGQVQSPISVDYVGRGKYYGFTIDGNERFLLGNYVVTHNTRLAKGLSKALGLPMRTINLGSVNDVSYFTGHGFTYVESEPGRIVQIMNETQCKNCIIYFDELDKIHHTEKGLAINGFLTHLIDPSQSSSFQDVYLAGLELDLSQVFYVFSFNDESLVDKTVLDRLKVIHVKDPSIEEKVNITTKFIIPEICQNIKFHVNIDENVIRQIVSSQRDKHGLRSIKRIVEDVIHKLNVIRLLNQSERERLTYYRECKNVGELVEKLINETDQQSSDTNTFMHMYS